VHALCAVCKVTLMIAGSSCGVSPTARAKENRRASRTGVHICVDGENGNYQQHRYLHKEYPNRRTPRSTPSQAAAVSTVRNLTEFGFFPCAGNHSFRAATHHMSAIKASCFADQAVFLHQFPADFSTGYVSPVSVASSTNKSFDSRIRQSPE